MKLLSLLMVAFKEGSFSPAVEVGKAVTITAKKGEKRRRRSRRKKKLNLATLC